MGKKRGIRKGGAPLDDDFAVPAPTIISEGIFLSGSASLQDPVGLQNLSISHCINCAAGDLESLRFKGIDVLELPLRDAADGGAVAAMAEALGPAVEYIRVAREGGGAVLVHCLAGVSRSATVVVAYLMQAEGWGLEAAFSHVVGKRPRVLPNPGFMKCLVGWEEALWRQKGEEGEFTPSLDINSYAVMMLQRGSPECAGIKPKLLKKLVEKSGGNLAVAREWAEMGQAKLLSDSDDEEGDGAG